MLRQETRSFTTAPRRADHSVMKILTHSSRFLLGLIFVVFGLNGFLHFIPMPPPSGVAGQFIGALFVSKHLLVVSALQAISGAGYPGVPSWAVPLALTILGPIVVNILLYHVLMAPTGFGLALFVAILWAAVFFSVRSAFTGIFRMQVQIEAASTPQPTPLTAGTNYRTA